MCPRPTAHRPWPPRCSCLLTTEALATLGRTRSLNADWSAFEKENEARIFHDLPGRSTFRAPVSPFHIFYSPTPIRTSAIPPEVIIHVRCPGDTGRTLRLCLSRLISSMMPDGTYVRGVSKISSSLPPASITIVDTFCFASSPFCSPACQCCVFQLSLCCILSQGDEYIRMSSQSRGLLGW